jgi:predicted Rossmann-fold nucleotide-binding protein
MIVAKSLGERKAIILERADAIVTLAGGLGTLDELTEVLELKRENLHDKPLLVLNTDGFYDGLQHQLERIANEKLFKTGENDHIPLKSITQFIEFFTEPAALVKTLNRLLAPIELPLQK